MKLIDENCYIDIGRVNLAHEFIYQNDSYCDYSTVRRISGLSMAVEGEAEYHFKSGNIYKIQPGDIIFLPAKAAYTIPMCGHYRHYTVNFDIHEEFSSSVLSCDEIIILHSHNTKHFENLFKRISDIWREKKRGYEMKAARYVYELIEKFTEELFALKISETPYYRTLLPAKEYIEKNYQSDISIELLSNLCSMSQTNFRRRFIQVFGETPINYRDKIRILYAKDYLSDGYHTVTETAKLIGIDDVSYFCRFFKKHTGQTPLEFAEK